MSKIQNNSFIVTTEKAASLKAGTVMSGVLSHVQDGCSFEELINRIQASEWHPPMRAGKDTSYLRGYVTYALAHGLVEATSGVQEEVIEKETAKPKNKKSKK